MSVSPKTKAILRREADRAYGGNVSALIEAIALEAERMGALDWLIARSAPLDEQGYAAFLKEMAGAKKKKRRRAA